MKLKDRLIDSYRNLELENKLLAGAAVVVMGVGLATNLGTNTKTGCETYQGYRNNLSDGERIFIFDERSLGNRVNGPNYALPGDLRMYKNLKIGEKYRLKIREPLIGSNILIFTEPCEDNSQ